MVSFRWIRERNLIYCSRHAVKTLSRIWMLFVTKGILSVAKVYLSNVKTLNCCLFSKNHYLSCSPSNLKLSVNDTTGVLKYNKVCFKCIRLHTVSKCKLRYLCFCGKRHIYIFFNCKNSSVNEKKWFLLERNNRKKITIEKEITSKLTENSSISNANVEEFILRVFISNYHNK